MSKVISSLTSERTIPTLTFRIIETYEGLLFKVQIHLTIFYFQKYNFGQSEYVNKNELKKRIQDLMSDLHKKGPLFLVFHDNNQDIK